MDINRVSVVLEGQCVEIVPIYVINCERVTGNPEKVMDVDGCSLKHTLKDFLNFHLFVNEYSPLQIQEYSEGCE